MGKIGRWIDSLDDAERDGIIEHPDPTYEGRLWWDLKRDCGCLVGAAKRHTEPWSDSFLGGYPLLVYEESAVYDPVTERVGLHFPRFTRRFGPERMWRVCKARAAKRNAVEIPTPEPATVAR